MADSESLPFQADYAKSSRASCKQCSNTIQKESLRIASVTQSSKWDGKLTRWFHYSCFFERNRPKTVLDIEGFNELRWDDQEKIKKKLGDPGDGTINLTKISDFLIEYAASGRASCRTCEEKLLKGELRISVMGHDERYGAVKRWRHPKCFKDSMEEVGFGHDVAKVPGYSSLKSEDQKMLKELLKVEVSRKKPRTEETTEDESNKQEAKKPKVDNEVLAKQNKKIWKLIDKLKLLEKKEVRTFVEENVTTLPRGDTELYQCAADILIFGATEPCPECKGQVFAKSDAYHCSGQVSAYTSCLYTSKDHKRKAFKVPKELENDPESLFKDVKYKPNVKVFPEVAAVKQRNVFENNNTEVSGKQQAKRDAMWKSELKSMKVKVKGGAAVDPQSGLGDDHHVLMCNDSQPSQPYSCILNMVDIARGYNSYYKLQLLESDKGMKKVYRVYRAWGRLGTTIGDDKTEQFLSKNVAIENFEEVYLDKTGNEWSNRSKFEKKAGKFAPVEVNYEDNSSCDEVQDFDKGESKLPVPLQNLIKLIANFENLKRDMLEFEIDMEKMPLGRLSKNQINEGYKILSEASLYVNEEDREKNKMKILDVSNRFFTVIPHDFGMRRAPLLDNTEIINSKCKMLDSLSEIESAYKILSAVSGEGDGETKSMIDSYYQKLKCKIEPVEKETDDFKDIETYVKNTHASTHSHYSLEIVDLFKLKRKEETIKFTPFNAWPERKLLWHGSRLSNFASILSKGLKIAPPEAPVTGYMFGKGVYFADMVSKSANYCHASPCNNEGLLLLCEVALGKSHCLTSADSSLKKPPTLTYSVHGMGKTGPDPAGSKTWQSGCVIPCGKPIENDLSKTDLLYNEFIVYDTSQIKMQYLVKVKFNFSYGDMI